MQHLFNRVYIAPLSRLEYQGRDEGAVIFITNNEAINNALILQTGEDLPAQLQRVRFGIEVAELLFHYRTYQDMLNNMFHDSEEEFFDYLLAWPPTRRLVIYVDFPEIEMFLMRWFRTILPYATKDTVLDILHLISLRERMLVRLVKQSFTIPVDSTYNVNIDGVEQSLSFTDRIQTVDWASVEPLTLDMETVLPVIGLEFLLATHLYNRLADHTDENLRQIVEDKVMRFVKRRVLYSLCDDKLGATLSLYNMKALFGEDVDITDPAAMAAFVAMNPKYRWLLDNSFQPDNYQTVWATYDVGEVFEVAKAGLSVSIERESGAIHPERFAFLRNLFKNNLTLDEVIEAETEAPFSSFLLAAEITDKVLNRYLLDYFFQLNKAKDVEKLRQLSVV